MVSTYKAVADNGRRMGRPPLGVRPTTVRLSLDIIAQIEALVGPQKLATFIREAVQEKLDREAK